MRPGEHTILSALMTRYELETYTHDNIEEFNLPPELTTEIKQEGLRFTDLKKVTGLSNPVLSEYLTSLSSQGIVVRNPKTRRYRLAKGFLPKTLVPKEAKEAIEFMRDIPFTGMDISYVKDEKLRKEIFAGFLSYHFHNLNLLVFRAIESSLFDIRDMIVENWREVDKEESKKRIPKRIIRNWRKEWKEYNTILNEKITDMIIPYIQMLAIACRANRELTLGGANSDLKKQLNKTSAAETSWHKKLKSYKQNMGIGEDEELLES